MLSASRRAIAQAALRSLSKRSAATAVDKKMGVLSLVSDRHAPQFKARGRAPHGMRRKGVCVRERKEKEKGEGRR